MTVVYYIIHNTHSVNHIDASLRSFRQQADKLIWDKLVIKNSIVDQIANDTVAEIVHKYSLSDIFTSIEFVEAGGVNTTYTDLKDAITFAQHHQADFLLFTKAEYCYSINSFGVFKRLFGNTGDTNWVFTPPVVNVTELGTLDNVDKKLRESSFATNDDLTGYDGDDLARLRGDVKPGGLFDKILIKLGLKRQQFSDGVNNRRVDENKHYQFIAHNVVLDINVHLLDKVAINKITFSDDELNLQWGRIRALDRLLLEGARFIIDHDCFAVHLFHEIPGARMGRNIAGIRY